MKITYINKGSISEGYIKTVDKMKDSLGKKYTADDIRKDAKNIIINSNRALIDKLMLHWFVSADWWANNSALATTCNLRPGTQDAVDYNVFAGNILGKTEDEQMEYLHKAVDFSIYFDESNTLIIEVPLSPTSFPTNTIQFSGNSIFIYLNKVEKSFNEHLKYPVKIKVRLETCDSWYAYNNKKITYISFNQNVSIKNFVNFFTERVVNPEILQVHPKLELEIINRVNDTDFSELYKLGDKVKFDHIKITVTERFSLKRFGVTAGSTYPPEVMAKLETLDGIENLLHDNSCIITISRLFKNNPKLAKNIEGKENIIEPKNEN